MAAAAIPQTMKAAAIEQFGGPEVLGIRTVPVPHCDDDEILIRLEAAGVGAWEPWQREGAMAEMTGTKPRFPYVLGSDGAGEVVAVGAKVRRFRKGERVYVYAFDNPKGGTYAEYVAVKADQAARVPKGMSVEQAAALAADGITALRGLRDQLEIKKDQRLLIYGASGGIGHLALQLARRMGARVCAIASGKDGVALVRRLGAEAAAEGHDAEEVKRVCRAFAPDGFDAALVLACNDTCQRALSHMPKGARVAYPNGVEPIPRGPKGVKVLAYDGIPSPELLEQLNELIEDGPFHLELGHIYGLKDAAQAHRAVEAHHLGKLALRIH